jgi:hypothetical protein
VVLLEFAENVATFTPGGQMKYAMVKDTLLLFPESLGTLRFIVKGDSLVGENTGLVFHTAR